MKVRYSTAPMVTSGMPTIVQVRYGEASQMPRTFLR